MRFELCTPGLEIKPRLTIGRDDDCQENDEDLFSHFLNISFLRLFFGDDKFVKVTEFENRNPNPLQMHS